MKIHLSFLFILLSLGLLSQNDSLPEIPEWYKGTCESGIKKAVSDSASSNYVIYIFGLIVLDESGFDDFYENFLFEKYKIKTEYKGCVIFDWTFCYDDKMREVITSKFGDDFFERTKIEALKKYKFPTLQNRIDSGFVFTLVDSIPEFSNGNDSLFAFLSNNIKHPKTGKCVKGKVYCEFVVEKDGSLSNIKLLRSLQKDYDDEVLRVMNIMPKWKPGILQGQLVRCRMVLPFNFSLSD